MSINKRQSVIKPSKQDEQQEQMEINGNSQTVIKKTLQIYSVISKVNRKTMKDDISAIDEISESDDIPKSNLFLY